MTASDWPALLRLRGVPWLRAALTGQTGEIIRFLAIGGTGAVIYVLLGVFLTRVCGLRPSLAIIATLVLLIPPTYLAQRNLTFRSGRKHRAAFPRYIGTQLAGNGLALVGSEMFAGVIRDHPWLAFSAVALVVAATNYGLLRLWTFSRTA
jgi:putative flippase GtrA